jgi:hypothetical protein
VQKFLARAELSKVSIISSRRRRRAPTTRGRRGARNASHTGRGCWMHSRRGVGRFSAHICHPDAYRARICHDLRSDACGAHPSTFGILQPLMRQSGGSYSSSLSSSHSKQNHAHAILHVQLTRGLRTRLSYASYKATHQLSSAPLGGDLELKNASSSRTVPSKRKATNNYYDNPATQGNSAMTRSAASGSAPLARTGSGSMGPPPAMNSPTTRYYPNVAAAAEATPQQSLFASILAQPPDKRGRTIHNPSAPPVPAPARAESVPRHSSRRSQDMRSPRTRPRGNSHSDVAEPTSPGRHTHARSRSNKGKRKGRQAASAPDDDVDMKAAATLTSLLLSARSSVPSIPTSPRSAFSGADGSDGGSGSSHSLHFAQSSARSTGRASTPPRSRTHSEHGDAGVATAASADREATPTGGSIRVRESTPQKADRDAEAADLMLFLATSPSPARPSTNRERNLRDVAAFRALGGGEGLHAKPRVLFQGADGGEAPRALGSGLTLAYNPSSSVGRSTFVRDYAASSGFPSGSPAATQLLPAPNSPSSTISSSSQPSTFSAAPTLTAHSSFTSVGTSATFSSSQPSIAAPSTPGDFTFNFNDFINVSPSPAAFGKPRDEGSALAQQKPALSGLRPELGRKLFEEEQNKVSSQMPMQGMPPGSRTGLGAGIDLVRT